jgi:polar amino acid transport system substrate-binding protein
MKMKKFMSFMMVLGMLLLTACGQNSDSATTEENSTAEASEKTITVITTAGGYPFNAKNAKSQELEGFMIDIINELASRTDTKTEFTTGEWSSLIPSVQSGKADVIVDGMYITEERKEVINFTEPVFSYGEGLIVQEDDTTTKSLEDLAGKTVGVQIGTSYKDMLEEKASGINFEVKTYQNQADMLKDIQNGRIDAALADSPTFGYLLKLNPDSKFRIVEDYEPALAGLIGIGISKEQTELLEELNTAIAEMKEDGTFKEIYAKWGIDWDFN